MLIILQHFEIESLIIIEVESLYKFSIKPIPWLKKKSTDSSSNVDWSNQKPSSKYKQTVRDRMRSRRRDQGRITADVNTESKIHEVDSRKLNLTELDNIVPVVSPGSQEEKVPLNNNAVVDNITFSAVSMSFWFMYISVLMQSKL